MRSLAIVITIVQSSLFFLLAQAALRAPPEVALQSVAGHCYYQLSVFFSSLLHLLLLTNFRETPEAEKKFPQHFGITRRYMQ